jgi:hypothetical protein
MIKKLLPILFLLATLALQAQKYEVPQSFKHLSLIQYEDGSKDIPEIYCDMAKTVAIQKWVDTNSVFDSEGARFFGLYEYAKTKIVRNSEKYYHIMFDWGPSYDPNFSIYTVENGEAVLIGSISATRLYIPGNGNIYAEGRQNQIFNVRQKFKIKNGKIEEVKQAMKYVGLKTTTNELIKLSIEKESSSNIAVLPKGAEVEVLLNEGNYFLIRTSFGLVGWWKWSYDKNNVIEGLYLSGD